MSDFLNGLQRRSVEVGYLCIPMYARVDGSTTDVLWTATTNAEFPSSVSTARYRFPVDLRLFDEVRWQFFMRVGASAGSLQLKYATTAGVGTGTDIISGGASLACTGNTTIRDTGWNDLVAGAISDAVEILVDQTSVTIGSADLWRMVVEFRAKTP